MPSPGPAAAVEAFHLAFLEVLRHRLDPARYALKGGTNLRYFFGSVRYSEDIDLDAFGIPPTTLARQVDWVLASPALAATLRAAGLAVGDDGASTPKQTDTTQRWKVPVDSSELRQPARTKIEFSHRGGDDRCKLETVPESVVRPYGLRPPAVQHYLVAPATEQKVLALAGRPATQARDVFDLELLLRRDPEAANGADEEAREQAADRALDLPWDAFRTQVLSFLDPDIAELYDRTAWERMQVFVAESLADEGTR